MNGRNWFALAILLVAIAVGSAPLPARAAEGINWRTSEHRVDAEVHNWDLQRLLEAIAKATGWEVYVQPGTDRSVTVAFKNSPPTEALKKLLAGINYSLVTPPNGVPRLNVYRTSAREATQRVKVKNRLLDQTGEPKLIPNELVVSLKPGSRITIEELARMLGAKVVGRLDGLNAYRLQFKDAAAANAARRALNSISDVAEVGSNYRIQRPPALQAQLAAMTSVPNLRLTAPPADGRITVGLIDTALQPLAGNLNDFLLSPISVAGNPGILPDTPMHGTAMAETILRSIAGNGDGSSAVRILPVDVYGPNESTTTFDVTKGVYQAVESGANLINMSLGGTGDSPLLHNLIQQATSQGVVFLAAAGNTPVTTPTLPAAWPEVTAVSSVNPDGSYADYANRGSFVDMVAPDLAPVHDNGQIYLMSGTSVSTAYATGAAAARAERGAESLAASVNQLKALSPPPKTN